MGVDTGFILALDEGTSAAKAYLFDHDGRIQGAGHCSFKQYYPCPGWVEHDAEEILQAQLQAIRLAIENAHISPASIKAIGIANQRETTVVWEADSGVPLSRAIVWQDRRTADIVDEIDEQTGQYIKSTTGLIPDAYFSASKLSWLLSHIPGLRLKAQRGEALFGTMDSFLMYRLTDGATFATDVTNAARTMLFDIHRCCWDAELLAYWDIPELMLPLVHDSSDDYGDAVIAVKGVSLPIRGCAGDQQAALIGQTCFHAGMVKSTYGTGNFIFMHTGKEVVSSPSLLTTPVYAINGDIAYALEGSIFASGFGVAWMQKVLKVADGPGIEELAASLSDNEGVYFVPALAGLGAPYWDPYARGVIVGLTAGTDRAHLARATLEAIAYLAYDVIATMENDAGRPITEIRADGGAAANRFLMQFQADIAQITVVCPQVLETTARGAAFLAGLAIDYWSRLQDLESLWTADITFNPTMSSKMRFALLEGWRHAIAQCRQDKTAVTSAGKKHL